MKLKGKRILALIAAAVISAAIFVGCQGDLVPASTTEGEDLPGNAGKTVITFPADGEEKNANNAAILETAPFTVALSLPEGWRLDYESAEEAYDLLPMFSKTAIMNQNGEIAGVMGFNVYEPYEGAETDPRAIYSQIALGNDYKFNVRDAYDVVGETATGTTAVTKVEYAASINKGEEKTNMGIVSYNSDKRVYIALELSHEMLDNEQVELIAKSICFEDDGD